MRPYLCFLCFLVLAGAIAAVQVLNGRLGGSIYFNKSTSIKDDLIIIWSSTHGSVARFIQGESRCYGQYIGRCRVFVNGTLKLDSLTLTDDGTYSMTAENSTVIEEAKYQLKVYASWPVNGSVGGSAYFDVPDAFPSAYRILWFFNVNSLMALLSPGSGPRLSALYRGRCELYHNGTLRLDNLTHADQGKYTVLVQNMENVTSKDYHYQLYVYGDMSAVSVVNRRVGETVYLYDSVLGLTDPFIDWRFNNRRAARYMFEAFRCYDPFIGRCEVFINGTLRLDKLVSDDIGTYSMLADGDGTLSDSVEYFLRVYPSLSGQIVGENLGGTVYLVASTPLPKDYEISIYFNENSLIAILNSGSVPVYNAPYRGRCELFANGTLRLESLTYADQGKYTMLIQDLESVTSVDYHYQLFVYGPLSGPVLSVNSTVDYFANGTYVSLHCDVGNQAVTNYTFYHDRRNICSEPHVTCKDSNLYFQPIKKSNTGKYTCAIENPVSSNSSNTLQLNVIVPASNVLLTTDTDSSTLVWPGIDRVSLKCSASGEDVSYSWNMEGAPLPQRPQYQFNLDNTVLVINPLHSIDKGAFTCKASNRVSSQSSNYVTFHMASGISNLALNSNASGLVWVGEDRLRLYCTAEGTDISFSWRLHGQQLPNENRYHIEIGFHPQHSNLTIKTVTRNDSGPFTCTALNPITRLVSQELTFNLAWKPEGFMNCSAEPIGQNVQVGCSWPGGNPKADVSLTFDGVTEKGQDKVTRLVPRDGLLGSNLTCHGDQLHRQSRCTVIFEPPKAPGHNNNLVTKSETGDTVNLTVSLTSRLPSEFTWFHLNPDPVPIPGARKLIVESSGFTSSLWFPNVTIEDAGKYECIAMNMMGGQGFPFTLSVTKPEYPSSPAEGLNGGEIAGIVIGVLAGVTIIGVIIFFIFRKNFATSMVEIFQRFK